LKAFGFEHGFNSPILNPLDSVHVSRISK